MLTLGAVNDVLFDYDFLGVAMYGAPTDEYMPEAQDIFAALQDYETNHHAHMPTDMIISLARNVFAKWFAPESLSAEGAVWIANEIVSIM